MNRIQSAIGVAAIAVALAASSGAALANPNPQSPANHGNSANAPGHAATPAVTPAAPAKPAKAEHTARPQTHVSKPAHDVTPAPAHHSSAPAQSHAPASAAAVFPNAAGKSRHNVPAGATSAYQSPATRGSFGGPGKSGVHKYTVCHNGHAITVDVHSWNAHVVRHGDPLLPYGTKGKQTCGESTPSPATASASATPACAAAAALSGVLHHTGSKKHPYVLIHPSAKSAHLRKHEDDVAVATTSQAVPASCTGATAAPSSSTSQASSGTAQTSVAATQAVSRGAAGTASSKTLAATQAAAAHGVLGASRTLAAPRAPQVSHGVLGTLRSVGTKGTLPFTGFPLWIATLIALALLAAGIAIRKRTRTSA